MMLSDVCLSVAYIGPKSITDRPRKIKIGTGVAHVTRTPLSISKGQRSTSRGRGILCLTIQARSATAGKPKVVT